MKSYFRYFRWMFLITGICFLIGLGCKIYVSVTKVENVRMNEECTTAERVFDYADKLTDEEEKKLRNKIADAETATGCDIVVVVLEETLEEYVKDYTHIIGEVEPYEYTCVYADNFYDDHKFGFNAPYGDGVILVDNWYREKDGKIHSWMSTSGRAIEAYSSEMIDSTLSMALEDVEDSPYYAYSLFVDLVKIDMATKGNGEPIAPAILWLPASVLISIIYCVIHLIGKKGKKTVTASSYVKSGRPVMKVKEDVFLTKTVTKRKIKTESSSSKGGGGGRHISSSGRSHGGGGHSR